LRSATSAPNLTAYRRFQPRPLIATLAAAIVLAGILAAPALGAGMFYIRGGGNGHGIGMSQYGSYGYALHGKRYRWILAHYYTGTSIGRISPTRVVRVLLSTGAASFAGASRADGRTRLAPGLTYTARPNADGTITLLKPSGKKLGTFRAPLSVTGPGPIQLAGIGSYHGTLELRPDGAGGIQTVDAVAIDDYVRGVISAEMPSGWSAEALKVQAVAARTYAITSSVGGNGFDLYADTRSQMYRGVAAETPSTDAAVDATRGQVVTYGGKPVITYFSASSGGHTESVENVWLGAKPEPWLRGVPDPYDGAGHNPYHRWGSQMTLPSASARLGAAVKGSLVGIRVTRHGSSPRVIAAEVVGTKGSTRVTGTALQRAFGLPATYATFTTITTAAGPAPAPVPATRPRPAPVPVPATTPRGSFLTSGATGAQAVLSIVPLVHALLAGAVPSLHGMVFPASRGATRAARRGSPRAARHGSPRAAHRGATRAARRGATRAARRGSTRWAQVQVQARDRHNGWRTIAVTRLGRAGRYGATLPRAGVYRVVYEGLAGPPVTVS
jgi:stage II sporulation protein D